jgi:hypothetical protein
MDLLWGRFQNLFCPMILCITKTLRGPQAHPGQILTVVGDNHPQRPQQAVLGVAAYSAGSVGDEVGDKLVQTAKTKGVIP